MLAATLYASLTVAFKARSSAIQAVRTIRRTSMVMDYLRADLQSACVPRGTFAGLFVGMPREAGASLGDELSFYSTASDIQPGPGTGEIKQINYTLEADPTTGQALLYRRVQGNLGAIVAPVPTEEIIGRDIQTFTLRYFDGADWQESWDSSTLNNMLPKAIEVTLEMTLPNQKKPSHLVQIFPIPCGQDQPLPTPGASP